MIQKKVCMVGVYATGKTSLVRQFVDGRFSDKYLSTVGVKIDRKPVRVGNQDVNLLLWDLEGRDGVSDIQVSYLRGASAVLYVVDGTRRDTFDQIFELRDVVERAIGRQVSAVAINKCDLESSWALSPKDEATLRAEPWRVARTSAKTGEGVEETFAWIGGQLVETR